MNQGGMDGVCVILVHLPVVTELVGLFKRSFNAIDLISEAIHRIHEVRRFGKYHLEVLSKKCGLGVVELHTVPYRPVRRYGEYSNNLKHPR
jgi:hypothetical protein